MCNARRHAAMMTHRYPRRVSLAALVGDSLAPGRPTWSSLFGDWSLDPLFVVTVLVGALYVTGVRRLAQRGRRWPAGRSICFGIGLFLVVFVTQSGAGRLRPGAVQPPRRAAPRARDGGADLPRARRAADARAPGEPPPGPGALAAHAPQPSGRGGDAPGDRVGPVRRDARRPLLHRALRAVAAQQLGARPRARALPRRRLPVHGLRRRRRPDAEVARATARACCSSRSCSRSTRSSVWRCSGRTPCSRRTGTRRCHGPGSAARSATSGSARGSSGASASCSASPHSASSSTSGCATRSEKACGSTAASTPKQTRDREAVLVRRTRTTTTGHGALFTTWVLTEPMSARRIAPRPREPTTTTSAPISSASTQSIEPGSPISTRCSTVAVVRQRGHGAGDRGGRVLVRGGLLVLDLLGARDAAAEPGLETGGLEARRLRDAHHGHGVRRWRAAAGRGWPRADRVVGAVCADQNSHAVSSRQYGRRSSSGSAAMRRIAASMSARWVNACGKFPRC